MQCGNVVRVMAKKLLIGQTDVIFLGILGKKLEAILAVVILTADKGDPVPSKPLNNVNNYIYQVFVVGYCSKKRRVDVFITQSIS